MKKILILRGYGLAGRLLARHLLEQSGAPFQRYGADGRIIFLIKTDISERRELQISENTCYS